MRVSLICLCVVLLAHAAVVRSENFSPPATPRTTLNFNFDWKFLRAAQPTEDIAGFEAPAFDDKAWTPVTTPHTYNDVDSFRTMISHGGGDRGTYKGLAFYRKHFKSPEIPRDGHVFIEFEGMRQAGQIFLNGKEIGLYENGVTAYGVDITAGVKADDNVLAVRVDNSIGYKEKSTGTNFEWNTNDFNPNYGGINRRVWLHVTGPIFQTLPLYENLQTTGIYVHADGFSIAGKTADITVESQIQNSSSDRATVTLTATVVDQQGNLAGTFTAEPLDMVAGEKSAVEATGRLQNAHFWSPADPYLYTVYTTLTVEGKIIDCVKTTTGFRKAAFKGGAGTGGVYINDQFTYLKGFAQRSSDEWAGLGQAYPDWMHDLTAKMIADCHGNYVRWMHVAPQKVDVEAFDRAGIVEVCPAGDKERDPAGRQWTQRVDVMRDTIIYYRNSPSILFWEAGNNGITPAHMTEMVGIRKKWDPAGGRAMGCRTLEDQGNTPIAEYFGVMIGQDEAKDKRKTATDIFRAFSLERRDRAPFIETEDFRDEASRRIWDDYSPPYFGFKKGASDTYNWNSETFALAGVGRYNDYWTHRISLKDPQNARWAGYGSIYFSDSNADGRQQSSETCRVSGKVDAVRLPKEIYFATRVMQSETPDIHILGHWSYPPGTKKTVYIIANTQSVELTLNGKSIGINSAPKDGFVFAFPDITFASGTLVATGIPASGKAVSQTLTTAGAPAKIKLTPILSPTGLHADGQDVALVDVEVVDDKGQRCPTDDDRIDFTCSGPAIWRGSYNAGKPNSTNNLYFNTECGINRLAIRSTPTAGKITITATRKGLDPAELILQSK